jgi:hypothetical protein
MFMDVTRLSEEQSAEEAKIKERKNIQSSRQDACIFRFT